MEYTIITEGKNPQIHKKPLNTLPTTSKNQYMVISAHPEEK